MYIKPWSCPSVKREPSQRCKLAWKCANIFIRRYHLVVLWFIQNKKQNEYHLVVLWFIQNKKQNEYHLVVLWFIQNKKQNEYHLVVLWFIQNKKQNEYHLVVLWFIQNKKQNEYHLVVLWFIQNKKQMSPRAPVQNQQTRVGKHLVEFTYLVFTHTSGESRGNSGLCCCFCGGFQALITPLVSWYYT